MDKKVCNTCEISKPINEYFYSKSSQTGKYTNSSKCRACFSEQVKANKKRYYQTIKERHAQYNADPVNKERRNKRLRERKKEDPLFRMNESLKARIHELSRGYKNCHTSALLDCTRNHLHEWLQSNFEDGMTMDNFGAYWHIDHVVPVSFFDNTDKSHQRLCFHWSNLRPLRKDLNMSKSDKIDETYIKRHFSSIQQFCETNQGYQVSAERCLWQRYELWYGNNPQDDAFSFEEKLKWAIRSQDPKSDYDQDMDKVQRLNASGLDAADHCK